MAFEQPRKKRIDSLIDFSASRQTWLFEIPVMPIALTNSSTDSVETP
jgi:hypothetical protein